MKKGAVFNDAFLVCHEIYVAARELVNSRVPTTQLQSASNFLWRPDLRPRLVEYVADFARAGERALGETFFCAGSSPYRGRSGARQPSNASRASRSGCGARQHPTRGAERIATISARVAADSFPHVLPGRRRIRSCATPAGLIRAHVVGLGRGDSPARGRGADPRAHLFASALFPPCGDSSGGAAGVDKRCDRSENGCGAL